MITAHDWYRALLVNVLHNGANVGPRGLKTREVLNVSVRIPMDENIVLARARRLNYRFMVAEALWMANGRADLAPLVRYNPRMAKFSDDGVTLAGAYGPWFKRGVGRAFALLRRDPETRQAFVKIGDPSQAESKDVPCTMSWQFLVRGGRLHMVANMRSSDAWLGVPYDVYSFSQIGNMVAGGLGLERGFLYLNLASSHLYEPDLDGAENVAYGPDDGYGRSEPLPGLPPALTNLALDGATPDAPWFELVRHGHPAYSRLVSAMTMPNSALCLHALLDDGNGSQP